MALPETAPGASARAIQEHYDAGNDFFALWLDPTLSYSCAMWKGPEDDLHCAQLRKIDYHLAQVGAGPTTHLLDIGCGWGGVLRRAAEHWGVARAVGLTLSQAQLEHVSNACGPGVQAMLRHWAEYETQDVFDGIISIGAFEHFAKFGDSEEQKLESYRRFFQHCHTQLAPGGRVSLQTIAYGDVARGHIPSDLFIANEVFPESDLPRLADITQAAETLFEVERVRNDRHDYARTLRCWFETLRAKREVALNLVGDAVVERYERYLRMFAYGFQLGSLALYRVTLRRIDRSRVVG
ncbi:MAG: class I SAM-dependent methyltransferase [Burkholderiaceae bacterium]